MNETEHRQSEAALVGEQALERAEDGDLERLVAQATAILERRTEERKRNAIARIKELAKEHGLNVAIDKPARKRGRPPKTHRTAEGG